MPGVLYWVSLRRARRGGLVRLGGHFADRGRPMPPGLLAEVLDVLIENELLAVADPDASGWCPVSLTEAGQVRYAALGEAFRGR